MTTYRCAAPGCRKVPPKKRVWNGTTSDTERRMYCSQKCAEKAWHARWKKEHGESYNAIAGRDWRERRRLSANN